MRAALLPLDSTAVKASHLLRKAAAKTFARGALSALLLATLPGTAWPDISIPVMPADGTVTAEQLESAIRAVEASEDIGDESLTKVDAYLGQLFADHGN